MTILTCQHVIEYLMAYLDGELPPAERAEFEHHLSLCPPCVQYLNSYKQTIELARSACDSDTCQHHAHDHADDQSVPEDLVRLILERQRKAE